MTNNPTPMLAKRLLPWAIMMVAMVSCQIDGPEMPSSGGDIRSVSFSISPFGVDGDSPSTRTSVTLSDAGKRQITWSAGDTVGIYPDTGGQVYFAIDGGAGSASSTFDGGGWEFKSSAVYRSYYPFIGDMYLDRTNIPVDFSGQKQTGNGTSTHIAPYTYMYTPGTSAEGGSLAFDYKHLTCVLVPTLTVPAGHYTKITLSLGEGEDLFMVRGHYDLSSDTPELAGDEYSSSITLDLDVTVEDEGGGNGKLIAYIVTAPLDMSGKTLLVEVEDDHRRIYYASRYPTKAYTPGTIYTLTNTPTAAPSNEIWYIMTSDYSNVLKLNLMRYLKEDAGYKESSSTYVGGKHYGILRFENPIEEVPAQIFEGVKLSEVILPSTVKTIGDGAFYNCELPSISLPSGVTSIGKWAFAYNKFTELSLPSSLTTIGASAFSYNKSLCSVTFGPNVTTIGDYAFLYVPLESLVLPESLTTIGDAVFGPSATFSTVNIPSGLDNFSGNPFCFDDENISPIVSFTGESDLISEDGRCLIDDEGRLISFASGGLKGENYTLPEEVKIIGAGALAYAGTRIGSYTFSTASAPEIEGQSLLNSAGIRIRIPGAGLPSTTLDEGSTGFNRSEEWLKYKKQFVLYQADNEIWYHNTDDKDRSLQIPFGDEQFALPTGVAGYEPQVSLPSALANASVFMVIPNKTDYGDITDESFINDNSFDFLSLPSKVWRICSKAFYGCSELLAMPISNPSAVEEICDDAFNGAFAKGALDGQEFVFDNENLVYIGDRAFQGNSSGVNTGAWTISLPYVNEIGEAAFKLSSVKEVTLGPITSIPDEAFSKDGNGIVADCLEKVILTAPEKITSIGTNAFNTNTSLTTIGAVNGAVILPGLVSLGDKGFYACDSVTEFRFGPSLATVGADVFWTTKFEGITRNLYFEGATPPKFVAASFRSRANYPAPFAAIYVPVDSYSDYQTAIQAVLTPSFSYTIYGYSL